MRRKFAVHSILVTLLLAGGSVCFGQAQNQSASVISAEQPLSYAGQVAISLAQEHIGKKQYKEALKYAETAISSNPKSGVPHMVKAFILESTGEAKKAASSYSKAVALSPDNGYVLNAYAMHLCGLKQYEQADASFARAVRDNNYPFGYLAFENAARCSYESKNIELAEKRARAALAMNPASVTALAIMAHIKFNQSEFMEARAFIQRLESLGPLHPSMLQLAQQVEKSAGDDRAAAQYQKKLDIVLQSQIQPPKGEGQKKP
ncbi:MAG: tetratricopeptide repeat protein [Arenimonas sp.]